MVRVRARQLWCPRQDQTVKTVMCPTPPPKKELAELIRTATNNVITSNVHNSDEELEALNATIELIENKLADLPWLVIVLHVLDNKHAIFGKDYFYIRPARIATLYTLPSISNEDGFFDGLPIRQQSGRRKQLRMTKMERQQMKLKILELRQEELSLRVDALKAEIAEEVKEGEEAGPEEESKEPVQNSQVNVGSPQIHSA